MLRNKGKWKEAASDGEREPSERDIPASKWINEFQEDIDKLYQV